MTGKQLFNEVFKHYINYGYEINNIDEIDEVTCYNEEFSYGEDWYNYYEVTFRFEGKKYSFLKRKHTSDNVCQTDYDIDTFSEVTSSTNLHKDIDRIIYTIENENVGTWEELIEELEALKRKYE